MQNDVITKAIAALPKKSPSAMKKFAELLFVNSDAHDFARHTPEMLVEVIQTHWELLSERKRGKPEIKIRTYLPSESDGHLGRTIIDMANENMPFLVDSIAAMLTNKYKLIHTLIHPILHVQTDKKGKVQGVFAHQNENTFAQSHVHIELNGVVPDVSLKELEQDLLNILNDVNYATRDWMAMKDKLRDCQKSINNAPNKTYSDEEIEEYIHFLEYLHRDNFTLLGYREYKFVERNGKVSSKTVKGSSLGLLHDDLTPVYINESDTGLPANLQKLRFNLPPVFVSKVNKNATVHRPVPMDAIAVKKFDKKGNIIGEYLFIGLFTSVTYSRSIQDIPFLRYKTQRAMLMSGFEPNSHDYKALRHVLEKYPRDELFQIEVEYLLDIAVSILRLQERQRIALYTRPDPFGRYVSCLVYIPRERYDTQLRQKMEHILEKQLDGQCGNYFANVDDSTFARVLFTIYISQDNPPKYDVKKVEKKLQNAGRLWAERLSNTLYGEIESETEILRLVNKYGKAFPGNYTDDYKAKQAYYDIQHIENVLKTGRLEVELYTPKKIEDGQLRLKMFQKGKPVTLSSVLPILQNMGLKAISEDPYEVRPNDGKTCSVWVHDFLVSLDEGQEIDDIQDVKDLFEDALIQSWYDQIEDDGLNKLILYAGLNWRQVVILRTYVRYIRQMRYHFDTAFIERALAHNAPIARELVALFESYHNPAVQKDAAKKVSRHLENIEALLENVSSLDEDRIIRTISNLIWATMRTNYYQKDSKGKYKEYLSIKLDSRTIDDLPDPKPYREIFVYSTRMEGVHLRGDVIARGGIRWSDRNEDFRTEILGLMKAQQVKNSLIVPMGAKGGFILKKAPPRSDREGFMKEGIACYQTLVRGMLDITDNRKGKRIVPPKNVVRRDESDPYLVVAADKGTASFSDIANALSLDYGFWLGDAFASGGSAGYDHKVMGITARGAWESVKRHFRELNHDTQSQDFDVIGVGDMGGDVFGNGMLLSKHIRLVGAFNHLHIFCDPEADPASSFKERARLFKAVKGWDAYDTKKLSKGGRIYNRSDKKLKLTPEIKKRFDLDKDSVTPNELINAMLKSRTDLLWFGGIGTYIKAEGETDAQVGDKANDAIRIDAREVQAHVIGEGANLAVTHRGRIEYARKGGRLNADFIDNSGGVDSSDHEVNIKILMTEVMANEEHAMTTEKRNKLLEKMTEEVSQLVLNNNYQQSQGITMMETTAGEDVGFHAALIEHFEEFAGLNRKLESLPSEEELAELIAVQRGLTRPELSTLQSYSKIELTKDLLNTRLPDEQHIQNFWLIRYFPVPLRKKYEKEIMGHRLKREIIATRIAGSVVNRMGPAFVNELMDKTNSTLEEVIEAYLTVCEVFDLYRIWKDIEDMDNAVPATVQIRAFQRLRDLAARETHWFLTRLGRAVEMEGDAESFGEGVKTLRAGIEKITGTDLAKELARSVEGYKHEGFSVKLAKDIAYLPVLGAACDIIRSSLDCNADITLTAKTYLEVGDKFHINWLSKQAHYLNADDRWAEEALSGLVEQLYMSQANITTHILQTMKGLSRSLKGKQSLVEKWLEKNEARLKILDPVIEDMRKAGAIDIPKLIIAEQRLRHVYE